MGVIDMIAVLSFGLTCFIAGYNLGKDRSDKSNTQKQPPQSEKHERLFQLITYWADRLSAAPFITIAYHIASRLSKSCMTYNTPCSRTPRSATNLTSVTRRAIRISPFGLHAHASCRTMRPSRHPSLREQAPDGRLPPCPRTPRYLGKSQDAPCLLTYQAIYQAMYLRWDVFTFV